MQELQNFTRELLKFIFRKLEQSIVWGFLQEWLLKGLFLWKDTF